MLINFQNCHIYKLFCGQSRVRTCVLVREQIYSLSPLTARPSALLMVFPPFYASINFKYEVPITSNVLLTSPFVIIMSHLSESNQRPTDYKSVALPAELKWRVFSFSANDWLNPVASPPGPSITKWQFIQLQRAKPYFFRKAKVTEFANPQKISKNLYCLDAQKKTPDFSGV